MTSSTTKTVNWPMSFEPPMWPKPLWSMIDWWERPSLQVVTFKKCCVYDKFSTVKSFRLTVLAFTRYSSRDADRLNSLCSIESC